MRPVIHLFYRGGVSNWSIPVFLWKPGVTIKIWLCQYNKKEKKKKETYKACVIFQGVGGRNPSAPSGTTGSTKKHPDMTEKILTGM